MSKPIYISRRSRGSEAEGKIRWDFPELKVDIDKAELVRVVAEALERRLRQVVKWAPSHWQGFAHWLEARIVATHDAVEYPDSDAFQRFAEEGNQFGLTKDTIEEAMDEAFDKYLREHVK
jgi:hypothetical protein